ncbi:cationic amino acid transporter 4-like [Temnothorax curvispinosus]|uniref:Cationic amino acid transporter 4-like n=1 Tax=Temnothorax curvispinosus TaxID=300111 RepID=A0A6J1QBQ2_9HYME|nr:cationic amino acid transporter 4-like [Temnothorax curvispinosus]XP_024890927.1 cationic amino acid transporter 4-like [Temnothorax curvispinosus]
MFSFLVAGFASILAALCYAELAARVPKAGSAYVYTYVAIGEFWAFIVGWNLILEHMIGAAFVAKAWSGYVHSLRGGAISNYTRDVMGERTIGEQGSNPDVLAGGLCLVYAMLLGVGVKTSATVNSLLTIINLAVMGLFVVLGIYYADITNWSSEDGGYLPYGFGGVITGAATCFYAYVGFDTIATAGEEARDPSRSIPLATMLSIAIVIVVYMLISSALTLVVPYWEINVTALPEAFSSRGIPWAKYVISVGALCGMTTTLSGTLSELSPSVCPLKVSGGLSALIALMFDLKHLVESMSMATLLAYSIVAISIILLRYLPKHEQSSGPSEHQLSRVGRHSSGCSSPPTEEADSSSIASKSELRCDGSSKFKPRYAWMEHWLWLQNCGTCHMRPLICACLIIYTTSCGFLSTFMIIAFETSVSFTKSGYLFAASFLLLPIASLFVIAAHKQNPPTGKFQIPLMPLIPALSILFNVVLIMHLSARTWGWFFIWMIFMVVEYFLYKKDVTPLNSHSGLMATAEAEKGTKWGSTLQVNPKSDKSPIPSVQELVD